MIHNHWFSIAYHHSQSFAQHYTPWFTTTGSACESWCVMLSQWLWIMVCNAVPEVVNHGMLCWAMIHNHWLSITNHDSQQLVRHSTLWFTTTGLSLAHHDSQPFCSGLWIMVYYAELVVVNHGLSYWTSGCESWFIMLSQWAFHTTPWFTTTGSE
jgi:hypothetical protein